MGPVNLIFDPHLNIYGQPVICLCCFLGGTDIIGCFASCSADLPVYSGEIQCRVLGMAMESWDEDGECTSISGLPPYMENLKYLEFCHLLFQASKKMSAICSKSGEKLEF